MNLSDTARRILSTAATRPLGHAIPPEALPAAARNAVGRSLLRQGQIEECAASVEQAGLGWRRPDGSWTAMQITETGRQAVATEAPAETMPVTANSDSQAAPAAHAVSESRAAAEAAGGPCTGQHEASNRRSLRDAAGLLLAAWDAPEQPGLAEAVAALRAALPARFSRPPRQPGPSSQPRSGTKQEAVLILLRRPEGAAVAQTGEATGWANHTVRGLFAGLKKRGIAVEVLERVRQVGPNKQGAKGSYTIYRVVEAG
jgi:hypothetical protein